MRMEKSSAQPKFQHAIAAIEQIEKKSTKFSSFSSNTDNGVNAEIERERERESTFHAIASSRPVSFAGVNGNGKRIVDTKKHVAYYIKDWEQKMKEPLDAAQRNQNMRIHSLAKFNVAVIQT